MKIMYGVLKSADKHSNLTALISFNMWINNSDKYQRKRWLNFAKSCEILFPLRKQLRLPTQQRTEEKNDKLPTDIYGFRMKVKVEVFRN
jgi:hypothetical protein